MASRAATQYPAGTGKYCCRLLQRRDEGRGRISTPGTRIKVYLVAPRGTYYNNKMMLKDDNDNDSTSAEAKSLSPSRSLTLKRCCSKAIFSFFFPTHDPRAGIGRWLSLHMTRCQKATGESRCILLQKGAGTPWLELLVSALAMVRWQLREHL